MGPVIGLAVALLLAGGAIWWSRSGNGDAADTSATRVAVVVPQLSERAAEGRRIFADNCASCHGPTAGGSDSGPPLVHAVYKPTHHADGAFRLAVQIGVQPHHWQFGAMPPQPQVHASDVEKIIAFVRSLQRANGVY